jgi:hypothetical protein
LRRQVCNYRANARVRPTLVPLILLETELVQAKEGLSLPSWRWKPVGSASQCRRSRSSAVLLVNAGTVLGLLPSARLTGQRLLRRFQDPKWMTEFGNDAGGGCEEGSPASTCLRLYN